MPEYLVELYVSRTEGHLLRTRVAAAQHAAAELSREGTPVRCLRSIFLPADETCLLLYEAGSADAVREAASRAALPFERISEADDHWKGVLQ
jgi:hypothetical protein